jgi:hypothetical protein
MRKGGEVGMTRKDAIEILEEVKTIDDSMFAYSQAYNDALDMAIEVLKAQEPRVETWEEAQANVQEGPFIIFEVRNSTGSEVDFGVLAGDFYEMSEGSVLTVADFWMMKDDYGKRFRLWTSRPTDAQREKVKWDG